MIRVGIIGLGFGAAVHLPAFQGLPNVRVVAVAARRPEKAKEIAARYGIETAGTVDDVLEASLDAVSIALPPALTAEAARNALGHGFAVLAEKPLAESADRAEALARGARGCTTAVAFQFAELECFRALKRLLPPSSLAQPISAHVLWQTLSYAHRTRTWNWKTDRSQHGGVMNLLGSHVLYLLEWLLGPIAGLSAQFSNVATQAFAPHGAQPAEDTATISGVTVGGGRLHIELSNAAVDRHSQCWTFALDAEQLVIEAPPGEAFGPLSLVRKLRGRREVLVPPESSAESDLRFEPFRRLAGRFVAAVQQREPCVPDFSAGARVQRLLETVARSALTGGTMLWVEP